jgi:hypothetical protein
MFRSGVSFAQFEVVGVPWVWTVCMGILIVDSSRRAVLSQGGVSKSILPLVFSAGGGSTAVLGYWYVSASMLFCVPASRSLRGWTFLAVISAYVGFPMAVGVALVVRRFGQV